MKMARKMGADVVLDYRQTDVVAEVKKLTSGGVDVAIEAVGVPATVYTHDVVQRVLSLPDDQQCEFLLSFGYPARPEDLTRPPKAGGRLPLEQLVHRERW